MDDPISALDARLREETRVERKRIQRVLGHTLVYVTHDQEETMFGRRPNGDSRTGEDRADRHAL